MRIRTIKPEWLDDERLALASSDARVLSVALILLADDHGNGRASERLLAGRVFPGLPLEVLAAALRELAETQFATLYEADGQRYYHIRNWEKHQRIDNAGKPRVPRFQDGGHTEVSAKSIGARGNPPRTAANLRGSRLDQDHDLDQDQDQDHEHDAREAAASPVDTGTADAVARVFGEWVRAFGLSPARTKLTPKRSRAIKARLAEFTADELCALIALRAADPWRREDPVRFELATLLRNHEGVELALSKAPAPDTPNKFGPPNMHDTSDLGDLLEFRKPKVIHG